MAITSLNANDTNRFNVPDGEWSQLITSTNQLIVQVNSGFGSVAFSRGIKCAVLALAAVDTGGGIFSWLNPEATAVLVHRVIVDVTTVATGACLLDIGGTAVSATTVSDTLMDGIDVHTATGQFDNLLAANAGVDGLTVNKVAAGNWVTGSKASGNSAGIVGFAYIFYTPI